MKVARLSVLAVVVLSSCGCAGGRAKPAPLAKDSSPILWTREFSGPHPFVAAVGPEGHVVIGGIADPPFLPVLDPLTGATSHRVRVEESSTEWVSYALGRDVLWSAWLDGHGATAEQNLHVRGRLLTTGATVFDAKRHVISAGPGRDYGFIAGNGRAWIASNFIGDDPNAPRAMGVWEARLSDGSLSCANAQALPGFTNGAWFEPDGQGGVWLGAEQDLETGVQTCWFHGPPDKLRKATCLPSPQQVRALATTGHDAVIGSFNQGRGELSRVTPDGERRWAIPIEGKVFLRSVACAETCLAVFTVGAFLKVGPTELTAPADGRIEHTLVLSLDPASGSLKASRWSASDVGFQASSRGGVLMLTGTYGPTQGALQLVALRSAVLK